MTSPALRHPIVVVGAGHAGLCVVAALRARQLDCVVVDVAERLGDVWRRRYDGLHLNTERDASLVPGTTIPDSVGRWPTAGEWADHIESAATQLGVDRVVAGVDSIAPGDTSRWKVVTAQVVLAADVAVVATGRNRVGTIPPWPGRDMSRIEVVHSSDYRCPEPFVGRRVLVVGAGNSGTEIAHLLRAAGVEVSLSMRTRPVWARRELFGSNLTEFARIAQRWPDRLVDLSGRIMQPLLFGRMKPSGLGPPQQRLSNVAHASGATLDSGFVADVKSHRIPLVGALDRLDGGVCVLDDGTRLEVDVVIAATGSTPALDDILPADLLDDGWPKQKGAPFEQAPGLFTAGLNPVRLTAFHPDFIREADAIADAIADTITGSVGGSIDRGR